MPTTTSHKLGDLCSESSQTAPAPLKRDFGCFRSSLCGRVHGFTHAGMYVSTSLCFRMLEFMSSGLELLERTSNELTRGNVQSKICNDKRIDLLPSGFSLHTCKAAAPWILHSFEFLTDKKLRENRKPSRNQNHKMLSSG